MKIGNKVKRAQEWIRNIKEDAYLLPEEEREVGIIIEIDGAHLIVDWSYTGVSWEDEEDLEIVEKENEGGVQHIP